MYGLIRYVVFGKEAIEATWNQTINSTQEQVKTYFFLFIADI